ncbi:MAG TPA: GNAT family N-acetyltransferase [Spirillospora sp.]|nr:GNAT family N-acetyltransferase [Spirillospora sp.]
MIRPAIASDVVAIGKLWEQLVAYHRELDEVYPRATPQGASLYARSLRDRLNDSHTKVFVAEEDGRLVGYVLGVVVDLLPEMFEQEAGGFLADIFVEEAYRGRGIGRGLVEALVDWFREKGLRHYEWHVAATNYPALSFWAQIGGRQLQIRMRADIDEDKAT